MENELPNLIALEGVLREIRMFARERNIEVTEVAVEGVLQPFMVNGIRVCGIFAPES